MHNMLHDKPRTVNLSVVETLTTFRYLAESPGRDAHAVVGSSVILWDPIFQGLAIALMAGEVASTLPSRIAVPVLYYVSERWRERR